jgi:hypothetical protein
MRLLPKRDHRRTASALKSSLSPRVALRKRRSWGSVHERQWTRFHGGHRQPKKKGWCSPVWHWQCTGSRLPRDGCTLGQWSSRYSGASSWRLRSRPSSTPRVTRACGTPGVGRNPSSGEGTLCCTYFRCCTFPIMHTSTGGTESYRPRFMWVGASGPDAGPSI